MIVNLENINKFYNGNHVLKDINLTIENNDRIGLIGINGCGKSTLLRILTGKELPDNINPNHAVISVTNDVSMGFLEQNSGLDKSNTIIEEMKTSFEKLLEASATMHELEEQMALQVSHDTEEYHNISSEYSRLSAYFEANEGYLIDVKIKTVLNGMGFDQARYDSIISTLSGGEKTRLALSKLLLQNPGLLILDEPTNHLDFKTIMWLEDYLQSYKGALLIVSHDRYFLDKLATSITEIEQGRLVRYKGNYSAFVKIKEMAVVRQQKEYDMQQSQIAKLQEYVDKNIVRASTSKSAKSRLNTLEKLELVEKPLTAAKEAKLNFEYDVIPPKDVLSVKNIDLIVGKGESKKLLCDSISFEIKRSEKVALVGANGAGKSSLLKSILNKIPHSKGTIEWTKNIKISYFEQENAQLNPNNTVIEELHGRFRSMTEKEVRTALGSVRLTGENVFKKVGVISGGERAKLCFAIIMLERSNVLILDEPTNHLDLSTKEVLEQALSEFDGTLIFVSHDRYLLNRIATRIIEITKDGIESFDCGFAEYMEQNKVRELEIQQREDIQKQEIQKAQVAEKNVKIYRSKEQRSLDVQRKQRIKELELSIDNLQAQIFSLEEEMTKEEVFSDYQLMNEKCMAVSELKNKMSDEADEWLMLCEDE